jgi:Glycine zipper
LRKPPWAVLPKTIVVVDAGKRREWPSRSAEHEGKSLIAGRIAPPALQDGFQMLKTPIKELRRAPNVDPARRSCLCLPRHVEVSMSKGVLALSAALLIGASTQIALADESGTVTGAVGGAVVGGVGGAAIGNSMTNHRYYHRHYVYHPYHHRYYQEQ